MTIDAGISMLDYALRYARMGWQVFPIVARGHTPATRNGFKDASSSPDQIRRWWIGRGADRNVAVRTCADSRIWDLDSDEGGEETIRSLEAINGALPSCPMQRTPSGGLHRIFAWPDDGGYVPRRIRFAVGLDALGERPGGKGGYFIAAPSDRMSKLPHGRYQWIVTPEECPPPQAPAWLLAMIRDEGESTRPVDLPRIAPVRSTETTKYGRIALDGECAKIAVAMPGTQNETLYRCSVRIGSLAYGGSIDEREAFSAIVNAGLGMSNQAGRAPWSRAEVEGVARRGFAWGALDPTVVKPARIKRPLDQVEGKVEGPNYDPETGEVIDDRNGMNGSQNEPQASEPASEPAKERSQARRSRNEPFQYLGYNREFYYYLPHGKGQIVSLRANEHVALRLIELASLDYWSSQIPDSGGKVTRENWQMLANGLIRMSEQHGIFEEDRIRGRGAWIDGKQVIVHTGTEAIVSGKTMELRAISSRYIYEAQAPWQFGFGNPASDQDARRLVAVCERLTWAHKLSAALLAGWCVTAAVSGALHWRPHIWITGPASSGKTTAVNDIVGRIVGPAAERFDGKTTEAAIRQKMGYDARPVILDEAESEDIEGVRRLQGLLDLARVSSSGGTISKGGANHKAVNFNVRSCFCFSSINTSVRHHADESRVSKLVLQPNKGQDRDKHYRDLMIDIRSWFTPEYAAAMFARTVKYLPTLLKNVETFTAAAAIVFGSRRAADQIGPMLAGYYLCFKTDEIAAEKAMEFISRREWSDFLALDSQTDEMRLLQYVMSRTIRVTMSQGMMETTIAGACEEARGEMGDRKKPFTAALGAKGIRVEGDMIAISDSADNTRMLFRDQVQWQSDWKRPMGNLPGAEKSSGGVRFGSGINTRATWIPYGLIDGTYIERQPGEDWGEDNE